MEFEYNGIKINISLEVQGEVRVDFDGVRYNRPSEFPDVFRELIETNPGCWDIEDYVYVDMNNWFEYIYTVEYATGTQWEGHKRYSDGIMCEWDISKGTSEDIKKEMTEICGWIFNEVEYVKSLLDEEY
jgi:hypothetical protein